MARLVLRRWWPLAGVAVLLTLAALATPRSALRISRTGPVPQGVPDPPSPPPDQARPSFPAQPRAAPPVDQGGPPDWIINLAVSLCVIAVLAVIGLLLFTLIRELQRRRTRALPTAKLKRPASPDTADVVAALDAGLVDLSDTDADPRRAVIACWVRLEQAAAAAGIPRRTGDTPADLVTRLLTRHGASASELASPTAAREGQGIVSGDVLAAFARTYREARYATRTVDERMRTEARAALQRLRAELTAGAVEPPGAAEREVVS